MRAMRNLWTRLFLRGVTHRDRFGQLRLLYLLPNPWSLDAPMERHRFEETNRIITGVFGRPGSILELGCGEGHQSEYLRRCCDKLYGSDISRLAVRRAGRRLHDAEFLPGRLEDLAPRFEASPVDLVAACEVLYYCSDVPEQLALMRRVGRACLVTCYQSRTDRVFPHLEAIPGARFDVIRHEDHEWRVCWWRNGSPEQDPPRRSD